MAPCPGLGFLPPHSAHGAIQGRRAVKCLEQGHPSGDRPWLDGVEESTRRPICICFYSISTPCPQTLSGKSLLNSLLGAAKGGRGWAGIDGASLTACQRLPRGGLPSLLPPAGCRPGVGPRDPLSARPREQASVCPARAGELWAGCPRWAPASPEEVLVRRWVPGFLSVLSAAPRGNPGTFIRCPTTLLAFQVCAG